MRVIVCGSRDWSREAPIWTYLDGLALRWEKNPREPFILAEGGAKGADEIASAWFESRQYSFGPFDGFQHECYEANWDEYGKAAGMRRNAEMLECVKPKLVLAFKDNFNWKMDKGGTENMVKIAKEAGVSTYVIGSV